MTPTGLLLGSLRAARRLGRDVVDFLYPPICPLCYRRLDGEDRIVCVRCEARLRFRPEWRCFICGGAGGGSQSQPHGRCRLCPPEGAHYQGVLSVIRYNDLAARCVRRFKYHRRMEMGELMARLMTEELAGPIAHFGARLDRVVPVPLHWRRRASRGFNQSALLARHVAERVGLAFDPGLLRRVRYTKRQTRLPAKPPEMRAANVRGAFAVGRGARVRDTGILLIDDVVTTGHTIEECARVLREAGAREVWVASFARTGMGDAVDEDREFSEA